VVSHAGSEQDAIQGALADCSGHDHGCRIIAIGPFSVVAAPLAFARSAHGGLFRADEVI
jgi:hypothetical protein